MHRWQTIWFWVGRYWTLVVLGLGALVLTATISRCSYLVDHKGYMPVQAVITGFGVTSSKWNPSVVVVASYGGVAGQAGAQQSMVEGCRIGDPVAGELRGAHLRIYPAPCVPGQPARTPAHF